MSKIILYGDSIMGGYSEGRLTHAITDAIQEHFPKDLVLNYSYAGSTTDDALFNLSSKVLSQKPAVVVIGFGVNDARIKHGMTPGKYNANLERLVERIGRNRVVLIGPSYTNWKIDDDQSWPRILQFQLVSEHIAHAFSLPYFDMAKEMQKSDRPTKYLQKDGVHLSESGNQLLVENIIPLIRNVHEKSRRQFN